MPAAAFGILILVRAVLSLSAQAPLPPAQQPEQRQPPAVFRAETTLVEVDAIVKDRSGRFVADLGPGDFEILEDGKRQAIEGFYLVRGSNVTPVPGIVPAPSAPASTSAALPRVQRVFILVFDLEHVSAGGVDRAKKAALTFLDANFRQGDVGGIVSAGSMVNGRLTSDVKELAAAVNGVKPTGEDRSLQLEMREWPRILHALEAYQIDRGDRNSEALRRAMTRACADDSDACRRMSVDQLVMEKARRVLNAARAGSLRSMRTLAALSNGLARVPGRKTVVLLSGGFFAEEEWGFLRQVTDLAARSSTRFYALDTRGLDRGSASSEILDAGPRAAVNPAAEVPAQDFVADAPNGLAVDTGGLAIRNENDFGKALNEIADDTSNYYVLAFRPAIVDGKFRAIDVRVKREGASVRARKGYVAISQAGTPGPLAGTPAPLGTPVPPAGTPAPLGTTPVPPAGTPVLLVEGERSVPPVRLRADVEKQADTLEAGSDAARGSLPPELAGRARAGLEAYQRGDVKAARERLAPAAEHQQAPPSVRYVLGWSHYALGDYARAVEQWESVRRTTPGFEPVYLDLADGYVQQREFGKAVAALRDAVKRWPKDVEVYNALGVVLAARGAADDAIATFEEGVAVAPDDETANYNLAKTLELRFVRRERQRGTSSSLDTSSIAMDRDRAVEYYRRVASLKGPLAERAEEGIARLTGRSQ